METTGGTDSGQAAHWNGPAGRAWVDGQALMDQALQGFEDLLVDAVPAGFAGAVLDVGCGTGSTTVALARQLGPGGRCVGVDISAPMLAAAEARAQAAGVSAEFHCGDAAAYAFEPAQFGLVVSRFGVMFFDDPVAAFANLRRATAPGGALRFVAWRSAAENPFFTVAERTAAPLLPNLPPRRPDAPGQFAFADGDRVRAILERAGWAAVDVRAADMPCAMPASALVPFFTRLGPVGLALQDVDDATRARVVETVRAAFAPFVHGDEVRYTSAAWLATARAV